MKKILSFVIILLAFAPGLARAESSKTVIINEIMWMGSSLSSSDEWIELYNLSDIPVDLSGFVIEGAGSSGSSIRISDGVIPAHDYFLISNYSKSENTILNVEPDMVEKDLSLSNSQMLLVLKDISGNVLDEAGDGGAPLAGSNTLEQKTSMQRIVNLGDGAKKSDWVSASLQENIKSGFLEFATPQSTINPQKSSIIDSKNKVNKIAVSGLLSSLPDTFFSDRLYLQDETGGVRVMLKSGVCPSDVLLGTRVTLSGFIDKYHGEKEIVLSDVSSMSIGEKEILTPLVIKTGDFSKWEGSLVKISGKISQTSGDIFYVDDGSGLAKVYVKEGTGIDLPNKKVGDFAEITGIVNNWDGAFRILPRMQSDVYIVSQNLSSKNSAPIEGDISVVRTLPVGTLVKTRGVVTVIPGVLGKTYFYIQDGNFGIQVYSWYKDFPNILLGDIIEVVGEILNSGGEVRIKIDQASDINLIVHGNLPPPLSVKIKDISKYRGVVVRVRGRIVKTSGKTFYISDGTGTIKIYLGAGTGIKKPKTYKNDLVEITGIVSTTSSGLRILPRFQRDFVLLWTKPKKGKALKAATYKRPKLHPSHIVFEVKKVPDNNLYYLFYVGLFFTAASLIYLKKVELDK